MTLCKPLIVLTTILVSAATGAFAQGTASPPAASQSPASAAHGMTMGSAPVAPGCTPMIGGMQMMMGQHGMAGHVEGRIAFLKAELKITDAQMPLWNAVADAMLASQHDMAGMMPMHGMMQPSATLPEKLAVREKMMTAHLEALHKLKAAVEPLYAALSDEQKKAADQLMSGPMGMGMM